MLNFQNSYLVHPQNLASYNGQMPMMMMPTNSFYPTSQPFPIINNPASPNVPFVMMATPQNPMQFYYHPQLSHQEFIQQQKLQQQKSQIIQQSFYEQQKLNQLHQNPHLQLNLFPISSAHTNSVAQDPYILPANKNQQQLQSSLCTIDQKKNNNNHHHHHQIYHFQQYDQKTGQIPQTIESSALIDNNLRFQQKVKTDQDNSSSENLAFVDQDQLNNSKKRTSVTSTASTASSCSNNLNESILVINQQQQQNSPSQNQLNNQDEEGRRKYLNQFEPHIQMFLQQLHEESYSFSFLEQPSTQNNKKGKGYHQKQAASNCFEGEDELQNLIGKNAYLKWAIQLNRSSHFAQESLSSLISNNQKYSNVFKLKKKIRKQQLAHNKSITHTLQQGKNKVQNSQVENQDQNLVLKSAADHQQNSYKKIAQKAEYNEGQFNEASLNINSYDEDSFDEKFTDKEENSLSKKIQINKEKECCDLLANQQNSLKCSTLEILPIICKCNSINKDNLGQDTQSTIFTDCNKCASQKSKQSHTIMHLDQNAQSILKTEAMDMEPDFIQMEEEEENEALNSKNCNKIENKNQVYKEEDDDENSPKSSQLASSKKVINSKFHNMNKLFMYKLLSSFYLENLERLSVPFNIREILKKLISLVKLSSKQQSQYQSKQKTDFFSHDHYNLLFLTLNSQTIQYMRENSNNKMLHLSCFNFDLSSVKLPLENSQNTPQILEKIEYINIVKKYACEIVLQSDLGEEIEDAKGQQANQQAIITKQIYTKRALQGIKVLNQGMIVRRF
ncbi:hypothetical protein ABPG74_021717 [Tetrahymena malaccensis]